MNVLLWSSSNHIAHAFIGAMGWALATYGVRVRVNFTLINCNYFHLIKKKFCCLITN